MLGARSAEITDSLVELLIGPGAPDRRPGRAPRRRELLADLRRVRASEASCSPLPRPPSTILTTRSAPRCSRWWRGATLRDLVREGEGDRAGVGQRVRTAALLVLAPLPADAAPLLAALEFRCNNTAYRPVMDALDLLARYAGTDAAERSTPTGEQVPLDGVVPAEWRRRVVDEDGRVERIPYELCVLVALRDAIRRREIWVVGANRWRDPEDDLPGDFDVNRDVHYAALRQAPRPDGVRRRSPQRLRAALDGLDTGAGRGAHRRGADPTRRGEPWISVPEPGKQAEPENLAALKDEVAARWGTIDLLDVLKEADYLTGFTDEFTSVATREVTRPRDAAPPAAAGAVRAGHEHGDQADGRRPASHGERPNRGGAAPGAPALRHPRQPARRDRDGGQRHLRGPRRSAGGARRRRSASDSKKFGSWTSNLMTEWHARYGGPA